jgi:hypothetical protein
MINPVDLDNLHMWERKLNDIVDAELKAEIEGNSRFEILNAEKITPHFIKLMKVGNGKEPLSQIKDDNGADFPDPQARTAYITDFYRKLFTSSRENVVVDNNTIPTFLGPEICNSSIVKNSILTEAEKVLVNGLFTVQELDEAVRESKTATASGPDGIGNACIKKSGLLSGNR